MKQVITHGIVLSRTNYQEADRILTLLTPEYGKVRALAKGVRKSKSKLAGGIELFSVSEIGFIRGKGELCTLTSSRLVKHYDTIVQDIHRTMLGYELIKLLNKVTEDEPEAEYFELLQDAFDSLNELHISMDLISLWFKAQLLTIAGHTPNLQTDVGGQPLNQAGSYMFSYDDMAFLRREKAPYSGNHIKFMRLAFSRNKPAVLQKIEATDTLLQPCLRIVQTILPNHIRT